MKRLVLEYIYCSSSIQLGYQSWYSWQQRPIYVCHFHNTMTVVTYLQSWWPIYNDRFMEDEETHTIDHQFLWGPALLISPVLEQVRI